MCHTPPIKTPFRLVLPSLVLTMAASAGVADTPNDIDAVADRPAVRTAL